MSFKKIADFEPEPSQQPCSGREHNIPMLIAMPAGIYEWECPECHHKTIVKIDYHGRIGVLY